MLDKNRISRQVEKYITYKRSLCYKIKVESQELQRFAKYTKVINYDGSLTSDLAIQWASLKNSYTRMYMARRLETLHTFAVYISAFDSNAQIPQNRIFGKAHLRATPHIYTDNEVISLMYHAVNLNSQDGIRSYTVKIAIGLLYSTGIRVSELTNLKKSDVRIKEKCLFINDSKFKKDRLVPLHPTVVVKLSEYRTFIERKLDIQDSESYFFVTSYGRRFNTRAFEYAFQLIRSMVFRDMVKLPTLSNLRHTFACNTIKRWYEAGKDVNQKLYLLSVYMGHTKPKHTYWYLSATPELLGIATQKFEVRFGGDLV